MILFKSVVLALVALLACVMAAPKPLTLDEVGRKIKDFGEKALPAVRGVCGFVNGYAGYPQASPQLPLYPQQFPQAPMFPQYPNFYPGITQQNVPVPSNIPPGRRNIQTNRSGEQDDLNNIPSVGYSGVPPPDIKDVFNSFDRLPKFDIPMDKAVKNNKLEFYGRNS